jgi:nucleotide-binding universal stress UspA family protein
MREIPPPSPAVVVGLDGSRQAITAALWAVDEAIDRDVPLRFLYAIEPRESGRFDCESVAHDFATADIAVRQAAMAIEATEQPVKIEVEIVQDRAVPALLTASHSAAMICIGAVGSSGPAARRIGSTAYGLLAHATCPVAIVRPEQRHLGQPGWVVTEFDDSADGSTPLRHALDEARLRKAPLHVIASWRPGFPDVQDAQTCAEGNKQAKANLERMLTNYRQMYPDVVIQSVAVPGNTVNYLARHADSIQLLVLGHHPSNELSAMTGPASYSSLDGLDCSLLIS